MASPVPLRSPIRILVLAASLRAGSLNARLAALAVESVERNGGTAELTSMGQFDVPLYDGDLEMAEGIPLGDQALPARQAGVGRVPRREARPRDRPCRGLGGRRVR